MKTLKSILLTALVLISVQSFAYNKKIKGNGNLVNKQRTTESYDQISVGGSFDVELVKGKEGNITYSIESNLEEYLVLEVKGGKLKIGWEKGYNIRTTKKIKMTVPFEDIDEVSLAGSGDIKSLDTIESDNLELNLAGSGDMNIDVKTTSLEGNIAGSGTISINGSSDNLEANIAGSGDVRAYGLVVVEHAETNISGSGSIETTVNGKLQARISGSGDVRYKGKPKTDVKISGSGSVSMQ